MMEDRDRRQEEVIIAAATDTIRPLVLEYFAADSCVATVRVTLDTLSYFGIIAKPMPVQVVILNSEAVCQLKQGVTLEMLHEEMQRRTPEEEGGAWSVGLGVTSDPHNPGRHLAAWVPSFNLCLDYSLDQASRPHKGLTLSPAAFGIDPLEYLMEEHRISAGYSFRTTLRQPVPYGPAELQYQTTDDWFRGSPNWRRTSTIHPGAAGVFKEIVGKAIRQIRKNLE